jgi:type IV secretion system protein VirB9
MKLTRGGWSLLLLLAAPAGAQVNPRPGDGDPHLQTVDYNSGQIVRLRSAPGYQLMVELSADEEVKSVALGDTGSWQVSASKSGDRLFIKPTGAGAATNMTVVTSVRVYNFELVGQPQASPDMPYTVEFHYPAAPTLPTDARYVDVSAASRRLSRYRISGDKWLRPSTVSDDGQHTYIAWPKGVPIPAVYAVDRSGAEVLINGMMGTDDVYVVDGAPQVLTFRIDSKIARAERVYSRRVR